MSKILKRTEVAEQVWQFFERPGYFGKHKAEKFRQYNNQFGRGNWRMIWWWGSLRLDWLMAVQIYEDAYYHYLLDNHELVVDLVNTASDVYDNNVSNIKAGLDYTHQETPATHLQDISVRRCLIRLSEWFQGDTLIQIRHNSNNSIGQKLSPGNVPFHLPDMIKQPPLEGWWEANTVEAFYQSNKIIETLVAHEK